MRFLTCRARFADHSPRPPIGTIATGARASSPPTDPIPTSASLSTMRAPPSVSVYARSGSVTRKRVAAAGMTAASQPWAANAGSGFTRLPSP